MRHTAFGACGFLVAVVEVNVPTRFYQLCCEVCTAVALNAIDDDQVKVCMRKLYGVGNVFCFRTQEERYILTS